MPVEATGEPLDDPLEDGAELWLVAVVAFDGELVAVVLLELQALTATSAITPSAEPATTYRRDPRERLALSIWCSDPSLCVGPRWDVTQGGRRTSLTFRADKRRYNAARGWLPRLRRRRKMLSILTATRMMSPVANALHVAVMLK